MNFSQAFSETLGKEAVATAVNPTPTSQGGKENPSPASQGISSDDMKAYVDAKFEALKTDLLSEIKKPVETPQEKNKGSQENNNEGGTNDVSNSDLSGSQSDS